MTDPTFFKKQCLYQLYIIFLLNCTVCLQKEIKVGGLFDNPDHELYFRDAVNDWNNQKDRSSHVNLLAEIRTVPHGYSFLAMTEACNLLQEGVAAIFGPESPAISNLVQKMCRKYDIPYIQVGWSHRYATDSNIINFYPSPSDLGEAYLAFVKEWTYGRFNIVYRDNEGKRIARALIRLQKILQAFLSKSNYSISQHLPNEMYDKILKEIARNGESNIIVDLPAEEIRDFLQTADKFRLMTEYNNYLLTSLDAHLIDLGNISNDFTNITSFRLLGVGASFEKGQSTCKKAEEMPFKAALFCYAVAFVGKTITDLDSTNSIQTQKFSCEANGKWKYGNATINYAKMIDYAGETGRIKFSETDERIRYNLEVVQHKPGKIIKAGNWTNGTLALDAEKITKETAEEKLKSRKLKVTTVLAHPYVEKQEGEGLKGNDRYRGYCVDLLKRISKMKGFKYEISVAPENSRGTQNEEGEWDGMIRELLYNRADLAIGDLTITTQRQDAVDFTFPFMTLGIGILMKKGERREPTLFSFLFPFRTEVWIYMATAYLGVTMVMYILGRLSPYEWSNPHPCEMYPEGLENQFSFSNSLWFTIGSVMQQGSEVAPRAMSTRIAAGFWWFFTLIMVSTYTANLAAFLTSVRLQSPIKNVKDLAAQRSIPYGCLERGSTRAFFQRSVDHIYKQMSQFMEGASPSVFTNSSDDGVARVLKGNYAFLMETTSILYSTQRHCELTQLGENLVDISYGIAAPRESPYISILSEAIIHLQGSGVLDDLKKRWWETNITCPEEDSSTSKTKLGITNLGGVFVVLGIGVGFCYFLMMNEFIWKTKSIPREERSCMCLEILKRIKDIILCSGSTRNIEMTSLYALDDSMTRSSLFGTTSAKTIGTNS